MWFLFWSNSFLKNIQIDSEAAPASLYNIEHCSFSTDQGVPFSSMIKAMTFVQSSVINSSSCFSHVFSFSQQPMLSWFCGFSFKKCHADSSRWSDHMSNSVHTIAPAKNPTPRCFRHHFLRKTRVSSACLFLKKKITVTLAHFGVVNSKQQIIQLQQQIA